MILDCKCPKCGAGLAIAISSHAPVPDLSPSAPDPRPDKVRQIIAQEAETAGFTSAELIGPRGGVELNAARRRAMYRALYETRLSLPALGKLFKRHHTSVLHAVRKYEATLDRRERGLDAA